MYLAADWCSTSVYVCLSNVIDALAILHWLCLPERVDFKLAFMAYWVLHGIAPEYLNQLVPVSDLPSRRRLRSSSTLQLLVPPYRLTTVGCRSFPVAASIVWNSLPVYLQSSPYLFTFRQRLKTYLFQQSFPDSLIWHLCTTLLWTL